MILLRIAIDGPAGAGKSTVARIVAQKLGYTHIDTGAMYRALTLEALERSIDLENQDALVAALEDMDLTLQPGSAGNQVFIQGRDVTAQIRSPEVSEHVSLVSSHPKVRAAVVEMQQQMAKADNVVMDGRDIGTVVMPDADLSSPRCLSGGQGHAAQYGTGEKGFSGLTRRAGSKDPPAG